MQKVTRSLRANLENSSKFVGHFSCVKPQFGRVFWNREFSRNLVKIRGCPSNPKGMQITLLHAKSVANEFAVISKQQDISPLLMELMHKGIRVVKTPRIFIKFLISNSRVSSFQGFWFLINGEGVGVYTFNPPPLQPEFYTHPLSGYSPHP